MSIFGGMEVLPRAAKVTGGVIMPIYLTEGGKSLFSDVFTMNE